MLRLRRATLEDLDTLTTVDLAVDREDAPDEPFYADSWTEQERAAHRDKIAAYVSDTDKATWVYEDTETGRLAGIVMGWFRDRRHEPHIEATDFLFRFVDESILPDDKRFCELFQLWVDTAYRRQGLATALKRQMEEEARCHGMHMIYTHTHERNAHVITLNRKLGYVEVRRGPMGDDAVRVSLVKWL
jgi:ribosomal protein S18 acetylase RimI-like enzyme